MPWITNGKKKNERNNTFKKIRSNSTEEPNDSTNKNSNI
jgi:hypothetical protein